jgi:hypothetical protein
MLSRRTLVLACFSAALVGMAAAVSTYVHWDVAHRQKEYDGWHQVAWPFAPDAWGEGQAWQGHGLELYVRPKLGFCSNCGTGVMEDAEVDRVTDIDLVDPQFVPLAPGQNIQVTDLVGRMRLYRLAPRGKYRFAEAIAVSHRCDLVVALVLGDMTDERLRRTAHRFLEADPVQFWVNQHFGER